MSFLGGKLKKRHMKEVSKSVKKYVNQAVRKTEEMKVWEEPYALADLTAAAPVIVPFTNVAQGATYTTRAGNAVEAVRIQARIAVRTTQAVPRAAVRVTVVKAKQCDGTIPTLADIFPNANGAIGYIWSDLPLPYATYSQASKKFQIIYDKVKQFASATDDAQTGAIMFNINKKIKGKVLYTGANGTDEGNGQYYLFIHTDNTDTDMDRTFVKRFYFRDA